MAIPLRTASGPRVTFIQQSKRKSSRRDFRLWLGLLLLTTSIILCTRLLTSASHRTMVAVATHSLSAGSTVAASDIDFIPVAVPQSISTVTSSEQLIGKTVTQPISQGALFASNLVSDESATAVRTVTVPIHAGHLPNLSRGALVDVWVTPSLDGVATPGPATLAIHSALVAQAPSEIDPTSDSTISLQVDVQDVQTLVQAMRDGLIDVAVVSGGDQ